MLYMTHLSSRYANVTSLATSSSPPLSVWCSRIFSLNAFFRASLSMRWSTSSRRIRLLSSSSVTYLSSWKTKELLDLFRLHLIVRQKI